MGNNPLTLNIKISTHKYPHFIPYQKHIKNLLKLYEHISLTHVLREKVIYLEYWIYVTIFIWGTEQQQTRYSRHEFSS